MFVMEEEDYREFDSIEQSIADGAQIFFALNDAYQVMDTCMIAKRNETDWEIMKFAADQKFAGQGAGSAVLKACIDYAKENKVENLYIMSNKRCLEALHLYRKFHLQEIKMDKYPFERSDIAFFMNPMLIGKEN